MKFKKTLTLLLPLLTMASCFVLEPDDPVPTQKTDTDTPKDNNTGTGEKTETKEYTLTFVLGNGQDDIVSTVKEGSVITYPSNPTREGYVFTGWDNQVDKMPGNNLTITAIWKQAFTLTFVLDNGQDNIVSTVGEGSSITYPSNPTRDGYTFVKWDKQVEKMPGENLTITAIWQKILTGLTAGCFTEEQINADNGNPEISFEAATTDGDGNRTIKIDSDGYLTKADGSAASISYNSSVTATRKYIIRYPETVKSVCDKAFYSVVGIVGIDLRLTKITSLSSLCFGENNVPAISGQTNGTFNKIGKVYLPNTVTSINDAAFTNNTGPKLSIYVDKKQSEVTALKNSGFTSGANTNLSWYYFDTETNTYKSI